MYCLLQGIGCSPTLSVKFFSYRSEHDSKFIMQREKSRRTPTLQHRDQNSQPEVGFPMSSIAVGFVWRFLGVGFWFWFFFFYYYHCCCRCCFKNEITFNTMDLSYEVYIQCSYVYTYVYQQIVLHEHQFCTLQEVVLGSDKDNNELRSTLCLYKR